MAYDDASSFQGSFLQKKIKQIQSTIFHSIGRKSVHKGEEQNLIISIRSQIEKRWKSYYQKKKQNIWGTDIPMVLQALVQHYMYVKCMFACSYSCIYHCKYIFIYSFRDEIFWNISTSMYSTTKWVYHPHTHTKCSCCFT